MRTETLFSAVDASVTQISSAFEPDCGQDMRWSICITSTGLDGTPQAYVEVSCDGVDWCALVNPVDNTNVFAVDDDLIIRDEYLPEKQIRLRIEPNDNTTGTINAIMVYKTYSN